MLKQRLLEHQNRLKKCQQCPQMQGKPVYGYPNVSDVMLIGQAPGIKEMEVNKPFAWTAGKTLFKWFASIGIDEEAFRKKVYMCAVCRCFPGKNPGGGDRVPDRQEISNCSHWLEHEIKLLKPRLLIPVGKLAISQFMTVKKLNEVIGQSISMEVQDINCDIIPLPHPSGASTWHRMEPGKTLLNDALHLIAEHDAFRRLL